MLYYNYARPRHISRIAEYLREADKNEITASSGLTPSEALTKALEISSPCYTIFDGSVPVGMFGVVPHEELGIIWMLGTDRLTRRPIEFLKAVRDAFDHLVSPFMMVGNLIDVRNTVHLEWLRWLGCEFHEVIPHGPKGMPFRRFVFHV